ncbi:MAG: RHS repeat-associated core domain-containing protein [Bacteroidota bacterium]
MKILFNIIITFLFLPTLFAQNIPRTNFTGPWGVQVNTYNGNLFLQRNDLAIPNQGLSIDFGFVYNSFRDTLDMGFGKGWLCSYSLRYDSIGTDSILVERADGRRDVFTKNNGAYLSPTGIFDEWRVNGPGQFLLTTKYGMRYYFDNPDHRHLTRIEDTNGNQISLEYNGNELVGVTDNSNRTIGLTWSNGRLTGLSDANFPGGRNVQFSYTDGQLASVTDPEGGAMVYAYEGTNLASIINEKGDEMQFGYNDDGRVSTIVTCVTHLTFTYNPDQGKTYVTEKNPDGDRITTYQYDEEGKLVQKTGNCCGYNTRYQYDSDHNVNQLTDANGHPFSASHDLKGNALITTDADGAAQSFVFENNLNRLQAITDKRGNGTDFQYDTNGNLERITQPEGVELAFAYDDHGNVISVEDGNGNTTAMQYNDNNDVTFIDYPIGDESFTYDAVGNLLSSTDGNNNSVTYDYDKLNRLRVITDDLSNTVQYEYDPASNLTKEIDANDQIKEYSYDAHNRLASVTTPAGNTHYGYDASDNLTSITDANGHTTSFTYDQRDLLVAESDAMNNTTAYTYDGNGNVLTRTDANGMTTYYAYDNLNRLLSKTYDGNTDSYSYDPNGNLLSCSNNHISMSFTYDALNRLTSKTINNWGLTIAYEYDFAGNRTKMTDPSGETSYEYDANNRLTSMTNPAGETTLFTYDLGGRLTRQNNHNGTSAGYTYDAANRLTVLVHRNAAGDELVRYRYEYDGNGNRTKMTTVQGEVDYTYDGDNRLMSATYSGIPANNESYEYDGAGNRTSFNTTDYDYDRADRLQNAGTTTYAFDANGNLLTKNENGQTTHYHYDGENRLVRVQLPDGKEVQYQYDPFGNRISQNNQGQTTRYLLDGDNVLMELDASGQTLARYTAGLTLDSWISMERGDESYFYHTDGLGSVTALTDAVQGVAQEYQYDSYGNRLPGTDNVTNPFTYTGREYDEATGLYYYRTRFYDAEVGRFLTKDKFSGIKKSPISMNSYTYVEDNPISYTDAFGNISNKYFNKVIFGIRAFKLFKSVSKFFNQERPRFTGGYSWFGTNYCGPADEHFIGPIPPPKDDIDYACYLHDKAYEKNGAKGIYDALCNFSTEIITADLKLFIDAVNSIQNGNNKSNFAARQVASSFKVISTYKIYVRANPTSLVSKSILAICRQWGGEQFNSPPGTGSGDCDICIPIVRAIDPNEIIAPDGCDVDNWVAQNATLPYTILYENDPDFATAPAQTVRIEHKLDPDVNPFSFRLADFGFGNYYFTVPDDISYYNTQLDLTDSLGVLLDVTAGLDLSDTTAFWIFQSKDPTTGLTTTLPADVGYLPVNDSLTHAGEGFVNFTVIASPFSSTFDTIHAQADIIFDDNPAILTNVEFNLIDADHPVSQLTSVDSTNQGYVVNWNGTDVGAGINRYVLYASQNGGPFLPVADDLTDSTYTYVGEPNSSYEFFTIAIDCAGNIEPLKPGGCALALADTVIVQPTGMESNGSISLTLQGSVGEVTYDWSDDVSTDSIATGLSMGTYQVTISDDLGCSVTIEIQLDSVIVATEEVSKITGLFLYRLFPVPASSEVNVEFISPGGTVWLEVFSSNGNRVLGRAMETVPNDLNQMQLDVRDWAAGSYLVRLRTREEVVSGMFVKQ